MDPDLSITENEILPLIYEAADNCSPPLFDDQPQEKINIISKLGFGMHSEVDINHEGETKWYTPMSCEKLKFIYPSYVNLTAHVKELITPYHVTDVKNIKLIIKKIKNHYPSV